MKNNYFLVLVLFLFAKPLLAQDAFVGEIRLFAGTFAPKGWAFCNGQLLSISQNTALFSLLGTTYGGNGQTTFALPNLQDRMAVGAGQGPGLSNYALGQTGGANTTTLTVATMPSHNHAGSVKISTAEGTSGVPSSDKSLAAPNSVFNGTTRPVAGYTTGTGDVTLTTGTTSVTGNPAPAPINIQQPILPARYIIALQGIFPQHP